MSDYGKDAGYCALCDANVAIDEQGSCGAGHGPENVSAVKEWVPGMCWFCKTRPADHVVTDTRFVPGGGYRGEIEADIPRCKRCKSEMSSKKVYGFFIGIAVIAPPVLIGCLVGRYVGLGWGVGSGFLALVCLPVIFLGVLSKVWRDTDSPAGSVRVYDVASTCPLENVHWRYMRFGQAFEEHKPTYDADLAHHSKST